MASIVQEQLAVAVDFRIQAQRQVLDQIVNALNGMPQVVATHHSVQGLHIQCQIQNAPADESLAVLKKINELAVKAGLLPKEVADKMGDVKGCWRRPAMPPVIKKDRRKLLRPPAQQRVIPKIEPEYYEEPMRDLDREMTREKMGHGKKRKPKRRKRMGEASELVGHHDHTPPTEDQKGSGSILARLTGVLDDLDKAIQVKEKDLNQEKGKEAENGLKLGKLKAADTLMRQARAMLEDYGVTLDQDADVIPLPLDPAAWVKPGTIAAHGDTGELWVVDEVVEEVDERVVKAHHSNHAFMKMELPIEDFIAEFEKEDDPDEEDVDHLQDDPSLEEDSLNDGDGI